MRKKAGSAVPGTPSSDRHAAQPIMRAPPGFEADPPAMLTNMSIRDIVLIERLDLACAAGLGVLTGETGAGKSILLDALGLALGRRAADGQVRSSEANTYDIQ